MWGCHVGCLRSVRVRGAALPWMGGGEGEPSLFIPPYSARRAPAHVCTLMVMMDVRMRMRVETDSTCDSECGHRKRSL